MPHFVVLYGMMQSVGNLGPGNMIYLTSAEQVYPALSRTSGDILFVHKVVRDSMGPASASLLSLGKPALWQVHKSLRPPNQVWKRWTYVVAAMCGMLGMLVTYLCVSDMTGVDLAEEDTKFMAYLKEHAWEGEVGEDGETQQIVAHEEVENKT